MMTVRGRRRWRPSDAWRYQRDSTHAVRIDRGQHGHLPHSHRSRATAYPSAYGFIPGTLADDGDPLDALVLVPAQVVPGAVIRARPIGMLRMQDEKGPDEKIVCVPHERVHPQYAHVDTIDDLPRITHAAIEHFFERQKDLEEGKWLKVGGWADRAEAEAVINQTIAAAKAPAEG